MLTTQNTSESHSKWNMMCQQIKTKLQSAKQQHPADLVVLLYLQCKITLIEGSL